MLYDRCLDMCSVCVMQLDPSIYESLQKERVEVGDVIYIEANSGAVKVRSTHSLLMLQLYIHWFWVLRYLISSAGVLDISQKRPHTVGLYTSRLYGTGPQISTASLYTVALLVFKCLRTLQKRT